MLLLIIYVIYILVYSNELSLINIYMNSLYEFVLLINILQIIPW